MPQPTFTEPNFYLNSLILSSRVIIAIISVGDFTVLSIIPIISFRVCGNQRMHFIPGKVLVQHGYLSFCCNIGSFLWVVPFPLSWWMDPPITIKADFPLGGRWFSLSEIIPSVKKEGCCFLRWHDTAVRWKAILLLADRESPAVQWTLTTSVHGQSWE